MYEIGDRLKVSLFGRSHADSVGCVITGFPKGVGIDTDLIKHKLEMRSPRPGIGTSRKETDAVIFEEGIRDGITTGGPILVSIPNTDISSADYQRFKKTPRPGHADLPALYRFDDFDISGGGQFSGRMTAPLVVAGAMAEQCLGSEGIKIAAYTKSIYDICDETDRSFEEIRGSERYPTRAADTGLDKRFGDAIVAAKAEKDSVGGIVSCMVTGLPIGFGGEWFDSLDSLLARAMFSIPGVKGVEFGKGFSVTKMKGSESNDQYAVDNGKITTLTNNMGGICGGMCDGAPVTFDVAIKPTPSIGKAQRTVDLETMWDTTVTVDGRHDPCIVPRAVPVVESMASIVVLDVLLNRDRD